MKSNGSLTGVFIAIKYLQTNTRFILYLIINTINFKTNYLNRYLLSPYLHETTRFQTTGFKYIFFKPRLYWVVLKIMKTIKNNIKTRSSNEN